MPCLTFPTLSRFAKIQQILKCKKIRKERPRAHLPAFVSPKSCQRQPARAGRAGPSRKKCDARLAGGLFGAWLRPAAGDADAQLAHAHAHACICIHTRARGCREPDRLRQIDRARARANV